MARMEHSGNAAATELTGAILAGALSFTVSDATGYPTGSVGPFVITLDAGQATEERILCASRAGTTFTIQSRGYDGTTDQAHAAGASVAHTFSATEADAANAHIEATTGTVHGLALADVFAGGTLASLSGKVTDDDVAGLATAQTLTNKTLTSPAINTPTGDVARGVLGYAEVTASQGSITAITDLTGLSVTVTVGTSRRIRIHGSVQVAATVASDKIGLHIREGSTALQSRGAQTPDNAAFGVGVDADVILTPSAGSHTYKLSMSANTGPVTASASATQPLFILVEDIGAA